MEGGNMKQGAIFLSYILIVSAFAGFFHIGSMNARATFVSGLISSDTTWDLSGSPYIVVGDINIAEGVTLTIEPAVEVKFDGYYSISINGNLTAIGTETSRIIITSNKVDPSFNDWNRIQTNSEGYINMKYCNVSYGSSAIVLVSSSGNNISHNNISSNSLHGIQLSSSFNNVITSNDLWNNGEGISLFTSTNNTVTTNTFKGANYGISLYSSSDNNISENIFNLGNSGIYLFSSSNNDITNNTISKNLNKGIEFMSSSTNTLANNDISGVLNGIHFDLSNSNILIDNTILSHNSIGIYLSQSCNNDIKNNIVDGGDYIFHHAIGFYLDSSSNNTIHYNNILNNGDVGLYFISSSDNEVSSNNITSNKRSLPIGGEEGNGIILSSSSNNSLHHNNIIDNIIQAIDGTGDNFWNDTYPSGGNYWSDYGPTCQDWYNGSATPQTSGLHDGICDLQRNVDADSIDYYPLKYPWGTPQSLDYTPPTITNLQPPDTLITNLNILTIRADYNDASGIDVSTVLLKVDGTDVTSLAVIGPLWVRYSHGTAFADGVHNIYLEVRDQVGNLKTESWSFTVDATPPTITALQPTNQSTTSDNTPTISAAYSDSQLDINTNSVLLKVDNIDVTISAIVTGSYIAYSPTSALTDGLHDVTLEVSDNVDNLEKVTWSFTVDTIAPLITNLQPPHSSITNDNTPTISADYSDSSGIIAHEVFIRIDSIDVTSSATVTASNLTYTPTVPLSEGIHSIYLGVYDIKFNLATKVWPFTIDTTEPTITNLQPSNSSTTNDNTPTIGAKYADSSGVDTGNVLLKVDNIDVTALAIVTATNIAYTPDTIIMVDGNHNVYLEVGDILGNLAVKTWSFTVDTTIPDVISPTITNLQPPNGYVTNDDMPSIGANYVDSSGINTSRVMLKVDDIDVTSSTTVTTSGVSYTPIIGLPDGSHTIYLEVSDNLGNQAIETWFFLVDTTPPDTFLPTITNLKPADSSITMDNTPTISADYNDSSGIDLDNILLKVDGTDETSSATIAPSGITYTPMSPLSDGSHTVYLEVKDTYGNSATVTWKFIVEKSVPELDPPDISNLKPINGSVTNNSVVTIGASYNDISGIDSNSALLRIDGIDVSSISVVSESNLSYMPKYPLVDGLHNIYFEVKDIHGNLAVVTWSFTIDATPPTIVGGSLQPRPESIVSDNTPIIMAIYSDRNGINTSSVVILVDGIDVTSSAVVTAIAVSYTPEDPLSDGLHVVNIEVKDNNGNLAKFSWKFHIEVQPPFLIPEEKISWAFLAIPIILALILLYILIRFGKMKAKKSS